MKSEDLKHEQVYRLTQDVQNPTPDRRVRHDWRLAAVIKAGTRFRARLHEEVGLSDAKPWSYWSIVPTTIPYASGLASTRASSNPLWHAILAHLEPVPLSFHDTLRLHDMENRADDLLKWLVKQGKVSEPELMAAIAAVREADQREWEAEEAEKTLAARERAATESKDGGS